jgi:trk system potassium uptake protein TrkA
MDLIIIWCGSVGTYLAQLLLDGGHRVWAIERDSTRAQRAQARLPSGSVVTGDGTDPSTLEAAGIVAAEAVVAVTGADETNLVVTSLARFAFAVPRVIARVNDPHNAWMFTPAMGVDIALNQANLLAHLITDELDLGGMQTLLKLRRGQYALVEEQVDPAAQAAGKQMRQLALPEGCTIVALLRGEQVLMPRPDLVLQPFDAVFAVVHSAQQAALATLLGRPQEAHLNGKSKSSPRPR